MQYALLIYEDETQYGPADKSAPLDPSMFARHMAFSNELGAKRLGGAGLKSTSAATTVRTASGVQSVHDGPFAETKEQLGGLYIVDAEDLDEALAIARRVPLVSDGAIEVRPLLVRN